MSAASTIMGKTLEVFHAGGKTTHCYREVREAQLRGLGSHNELLRGGYDLSDRFGDFKLLSWVGGRRFEGFVEGRKVDTGGLTLINYGVNGGGDDVAKSLQFRGHGRCALWKFAA